MPNLLRTSVLIVVTLFILVRGATTLPPQQAAAPITIRAAQVIDGRGGGEMFSSLCAGRKSGVLRRRPAKRVTTSAQ